MVKAARAHDGASGAGVKSKIERLPTRNHRRAWPGGDSYCSTAQMAAAGALFSILLVAEAVILPSSAIAQEEPITEEKYEREELGVNPYTAPPIARVFQQLDKLKPLPFEQVRRDFPRASPASREQKGMIFGGLVADGFLIVEAEKKNLIGDLGGVLMREARGLGVADRVMRHSASLTELGRHGDWPAVRQELIATQADVEQAMIELRDQKMAHLISLGGWLRGLEISAGAVETDFSAERAKVLAEPELVEYFAGELKTLPPSIAHAPLFEKLREGVKRIRALLPKSAGEELKPADVKAIHAEARELNLAIRRFD
jgi:hypothetical protein